MFEKKLVHGYDAHEVLYLYCVSGAWVRASGFTTGPIRSHSENVSKFLPFLSIKGQNGSLTLSCQSTLYALSLLPRRRIIGQRHPHLKVVKHLLMHICQKFCENGIQRGFGMQAKDEKENGDAVDHNVVEREEGASDRYHGGPHNTTAGELGSQPETAPRGNHPGTGRWQAFPVLGQQ